MTKRTIFHLRRWLLLLAITVLWVVTSDAQEPRAGGEKHVVPLSVIDRDGKPIPNLTAEQLRVRGINAEWRLSFDDGPRRVLLIVDARVSTHDKGRWDRARVFVKTLLKIAADDIEMALRILTGGEEVVVSFNHDRGAIYSVIDSVPKKGIPVVDGSLASRPILMDAILSAAGAPLGFGDAIQVVSGCIRFDRGSVESASAGLAGRGVRLFHMNVTAPFLLPYTGMYVPGRLTRFEWMVCAGLPKPTVAEVVEHTGGMGFNLLSPPASRNPSSVFMIPKNFFEAVAHEAYTLIKHTYRLELQLKEPLKERRKLKVVVRDKRVKKQFKPKLFFPKVLYPKPASNKDLAPGQKSSEE